MKITIEKRKAKGGKENLRLVYYYGYNTKVDDGKITHHRKKKHWISFYSRNPGRPLSSNIIKMLSS